MILDGLDPLVISPFEPRTQHVVVTDDGCECGPERLLIQIA